MSNWQSQTANRPFIRRAVHWVASNDEPYASGQIDVSGSPWNGAANLEVGQSILSAWPEDAINCGVWLITALDTENDTATVERRDDSQIGAIFTCGEGLYDLINQEAYQCAQCSEDDVNVEQTTLDGEGHFIGWSLANSGQNAAFSVLTVNELQVNNLARIEQVRNFSRRLPATQVFTSGMSPVQLTVDDYFVVVDASGGDVLVKLPPISGTSTRSMVIKRIDSSGNVVTVGVALGSSLESVLNGTMTVDSMEAVHLECTTDPDSWWKV